MDKKKLAFLCIPGLETFVKPFIKLFEDEYEIRTCFENSLYEMLKIMHWADIIWFEWANELAYKLTNYDQNQWKEIVGNKQVIVRYHSYELFTQLPKLIKWENVTDCIFVADHVFQEANADLPTDLRVHHIPNGVNTKKFNIIGEKKNNKQIAYIGHVNNKKGPMLMAHAFYQLQQETDNAYHLHIAGDVQDKRYEYYLNHIFNKMDLTEHITFHNFIEDMPAFLQDISHVICTSPWESQNMSVMEGMACGCMPIVHNFMGSEDIYDNKYLWTTIKEFVLLIKFGKLEPEAHRSWVVEHFNLEGVKKEIGEIFKRFRPRKLPEVDAGAVDAVEGSNIQRPQPVA